MAPRDAAVREDPSHPEVLGRRQLIHLLSRNGDRPLYSAETVSSTNAPSLAEHFVRELVLQEILLILRVHTSLNPADGGTKVLGPKIFAFIAELMMGGGDLVEVTKRVLTVVSDDFA
jgi:hypothetical protein